MAEHRTEQNEVSSPGNLKVFLRAKREIWEHLCSSSAEERGKMKTLTFLSGKFDL